MSSYLASYLKKERDENVEREQTKNLQARFEQYYFFDLVTLLAKIFNQTILQGSEKSFFSTHPRFYSNR